MRFGGSGDGGSGGGGASLSAMPIRIWIHPWRLAGTGHDVRGGAGGILMLQSRNSNVAISYTDIRISGKHVSIDTFNENKLY